MTGRMHDQAPIFSRALRGEILLLLGAKAVALYALYLVFFSHPVPKPDLAQATASHLLVQHKGN